MQRRNSGRDQSYESEYDGYGNRTDAYRRNHEREDESREKSTAGDSAEEQEKNYGGHKSFKSRSGRSGFGGRRR